MRVSIDPMDKNYVVGVTHIDAYVNNVLIQNCITADEEQGYVIAFKRKPGSQIYESLNGVAQRERVEGKVVVAGAPYTRRIGPNWHDPL